MEILSITGIWRFLTWLPGFCLRRIFTKERMADLILVDVRPRHDYCTVNLGNSASFNLWVRIINLSAFDVELDRAELKFWCGGTNHKSAILKKSTISAGEIVDHYFSENIADGQANQIRSNIGNLQTRIELDIEFNCELHNFQKSTGSLEGLRPRFLNV